MYSAIKKFIFTFFIVFLSNFNVFDPVESLDNLNTNKTVKIIILLS